MNGNYLLCYIPRREDGRIELESETYNTFEDAVKRYTLLCSVCTQVVLSDTKQNHIIYQYMNENNGCANKKTIEALSEQEGDFTAPFKRWWIELIYRKGRYEYEDLRPGDIFSLSYGGGKTEFFVHHLEAAYKGPPFLAAVSLHDGEKLRMKGESTVDAYDKKFICDENDGGKLEDRFVEKVELVPLQTHYYYQDLSQGDIFSLSRGQECEFYVHQVKEYKGHKTIFSISLRDGSELRIDGETPVTVYDTNLMPYK